MTEKNKKSKAELLKDRLCDVKKSSWLLFSEAEKKTVFSFAEDYKKFLSDSKTERLCAANILKLLKADGFKNMNSVQTAKPGDRLFKFFKEKTIIAFIVGNNPSEFRLVGSHIDSPRLDLKPSPIYEDSDLALFKTHYYGGIKKYHWVNTPLALHGIIFTKKGERIELSIGEKDSDPKFIISDLLPHLAHDQMEKKASKVVEGEEMNLLIGNIPLNDDKIEEQVKLAVLQKLNDDYGLSEEDFKFAEIELVPADNASDIGFDRSLIAAYGQDDRICAYSSLRSLLDVKNPVHTAVGLFVDKEEIGSMGDTGAASLILQNFAVDYSALLKLKISSNRLLEYSRAISADVTAGMNPNYKDVHDPLNVSVLGRGVSIEKYGGGGGKFGTHDAHAEYMHYLRTILVKNKVAWQTGELGKIDVGGGGTIGMFLSRYGMDCVDAGPALLGMHSPYEVASKADLYSAYKFYKGFFED